MVAIDYRTFPVKLGPGRILPSDTITASEAMEDASGTDIVASGWIVGATLIGAAGTNATLTVYNDVDAADPARNLVTFVPPLAIQTADAGTGLDGIMFNDWLPAEHWRYFRSAAEIGEATSVFASKGVGILAANLWYVLDPEAA